jgi:Co/Zn/Cd efflux system component
MSMQNMVIVALSGLLAAFVGAYLFRKDTQLENKKRKAIELAAKLKQYGLVQIPALLIDFAVGDLSDFLHRVHMMAEMFTGDEKALFAELDGIFERVLEAKLHTEEGRAYLHAKLGEHESAKPE